MDESTTKGMAYNLKIRTKQGGFTPEEVARRVAFNRRISRTTVVDVLGYDTGLAKDDIKSALRDHFGSCGEIKDVIIGSRRAYITIFGQDARLKALELNGSHLRGRKILVTCGGTQVSAPLCRRPPSGRPPHGFNIPDRCKYIKSHKMKAFGVESSEAP